MRSLLLLLAFASLACAIEVVDEVRFRPLSQSDLVSMAQSGEYNVIGRFTNGDGNAVSASELVQQVVVDNGQLPSFSGSFCNPLGVRIGSPFGACRSKGGNPCGRSHAGVDLFASRGIPVKAAAAGVAYKHLTNPTGYGIAVYVNHADGSQTRYAHLNSISIENGQRVSQGQVIGTVGNTGNARTTPPHLHFEIRKNGNAVNPASLIAGRNC
ncbi:MAG: M23 family metallopeptidase [Candidatus Micrarchaeota archaeon]